MSIPEPQEPRHKHFTDKWLQSLSRKPLKPTDNEYRKPWWDTRAPGLCIRQGAKISFYVGKRPPGAKQFKWIRLGDYPALPLADGRSRASEIVGAIVDGRPAPVRPRGAVTFADIAEEFIEEVLPTTRKGQPKRTAAAEEKAFRDEVLPVLGKRPIAQIDHADIVECLEAIAGRTRRKGARLESGGPHAVRKILPTINRFFEWAAYRRKGGLQTNPMTAITASELLSGKSFNTVRDHVPSAADLRLVWRAALDTPYPFGPLILALILSGQRLSEIAEARRSEIDGECLVIPAERMKNRQVHAVPLTATLRALLDEMPSFDGGDFIFSTTGGKRPISGFSKYKTRFDRAAAELGQVESWRIHDLRRAVRTGLSEAGVLPFHAELVIAHTQVGVHAVYDRHRYDAEKRKALIAWERRLVNIVKPLPPSGTAEKRPADVVLLRTMGARA
jgi:integrase